MYNIYKYTLFNLKREGIIKDPRVERAMLLEDRRQFCPNITFPYADQPQGIGHGATISAPHMVIRVKHDGANHICANPTCAK